MSFDIDVKNSIIALVFREINVFKVLLGDMIQD
jgi:hypothetical protein